MLGIDYEQMNELEEDARLEDCDTCGSDEKNDGTQCLACGGPVNVITPRKYMKHWLALDYQHQEIRCCDGKKPKVFTQVTAIQEDVTCKRCWVQIDQSNELKNRYAKA